MTLQTLSSLGAACESGLYCLNGGTCAFTAINNSVSCACAKGFTGTRCQDQAMPMFFCPEGNSICPRGGRCVIDGGSHMCLYSADHMQSVFELGSSNSTRRGEARTWSELSSQNERLIAIVGIIMGCCALVGVAAMVAVTFRRRSRQRAKQNDAEAASDESLRRRDIPKAQAMCMRRAKSEEAPTFGVTKHNKHSSPLGSNGQGKGSKEHLQSNQKTHTTTRDQKGCLTPPPQRISDKSRRGLSPLAKSSECLTERSTDQRRKAALMRQLGMSDKNSHSKNSLPEDKPQLLSRSQSDKAKKFQRMLSLDVPAVKIDDADENDKLLN